VVQRGIVAVGDGVHPAEGRQAPEPQVSLLGAGAQEEVGPTHLLVQGRRRPPHRVVPPALAERLAALFELFQVHRVVEVGDHDLLRVAQPRSSGHHPALEHDDIAPGQEPPQLGVRCEPSVEAVVLQLAPRRGGEHHVVGGGQSPRDLDRSDPRAGHHRSDDVGGDHDDPAPLTSSVRCPPAAEDLEGIGAFG
jgi:hypothetical protein